MRKVMLGLVSCVAIAGMASAEDVNPVKERALNGPTIRVVPSTRSVAPGETFTVEVFVANVEGLGGYQVGLKVNGGTHGQLSLEQLVVDNAREDYALGDAQVVKAEALHAGQMGAVRMNGASDVARAGYLGTYTYRVPIDAEGTFTIELDKDKRNTFLRSGAGTAIAFVPGKAAAISVSSVTVDRVGDDGK
jgi:hypothetical protein